MVNLSHSYCFFYTIKYCQKQENKIHNFIPKQQAALSFGAQLSSPYNNQPFYSVVVSPPISDQAKHSSIIYSVQ